MKKFYKVFCAVLLVLLCIQNVSFAEDTEVSIYVNGREAVCGFAPIVRDGVTLADAEAISSKLGLKYRWFEESGSATISSSTKSICITPGENYMTVSDLTGRADYEYYHHRLLLPCMFFGNDIAMPVRDLASVFGYPLSFDINTQIVYLGYNPNAETTRALNDGHTYYFQNQSGFNLPGFGSGYCWVCSYAMVLSDVTGRIITPNDVAAVNLRFQSQGEYCYHYDILSEFGARFVSALSENSAYYAGRDAVSGGTYIENPLKDDNVVREALKEALSLHPEGVLVRYAQFPHTMVAVGVDGNTILFNDPAPTSSSAYAEVGRYQGVPFSETCVASKGFNLADLTFIQAID